MLTPQDIHAKSFSNSFKGYDKDEVDQFLDRIIEDYDKLTRENRELLARIESLGTQIETYRGMEDTLMHTMVTAHKAAEDISKAAKQDSEEILDAANKEADELLLKTQVQAEEVLNKQQAQMRENEEKLAEMKDVMLEFRRGAKEYALDLIDTIESVSDIYLPEEDDFNEESLLDIAQDMLDDSNEEEATVEIAESKAEAISFEDEEYIHPIPNVSQQEPTVDLIDDLEEDPIPVYRPSNRALDDEDRD